jgi:hypothetical protein
MQAFAVFGFLVLLGVRLLSSSRLVRIFAGAAKMTVFAQFQSYVSHSCSNTDES